MENEFPPNSHGAKEVRPSPRAAEKPPEKKDVARITTSNVIQRKKPLHKKFLEAFRPEDNKGFIEHVLLDLLVPGIKDAVADASTAAIDNALGTGIGSRRGRSRGSQGGYTPYGRMSEARPRERDAGRRSERRDVREPSDHSEVIIGSRVEAEEVLEAMIEMISVYGLTTKRDLLSMTGSPYSFTDEDWGWRDLRGARIHRVGRDGYLLDLPRPEPLD